jgi:ABC-2 type transport system permease protein
MARKDLKIFLKERGTLLYLFVIPILFILAFGGATGMASDPQEEAIILPVVNLDPDSDASQALLDALNQVGGIQCETYDEAQAKANLDRGKIDRMLTIPANYAADLQAGHPVTLLLVNGPDANPAKTEAVRGVVAGVAADLSLKTQLIASFRQMADMQAATNSEQQVFTAEIIIEQAQSQFDRSRTEPLLAVEESWPEQILDENEQDINPLSVYVPGFAVLFIFLTAQTTAQSIYEEKKVGSFRRLLAAPISKITILVGKMIPNFLIGFVQIIVLFSAGVLVFPVLGLDPMSLGNDPLALILICLVVVLCSTSLGVLIAAIARTEGQIGGLSSVVLWAFGFAGIALVQIPSTQIFDTISKVIPHYWANTAFLDLFVRGQGLTDIAPGIGVLLGFTVVFFAVGLWRFDYT